MPKIKFKCPAEQQCLKAIGLKKNNPTDGASAAAGEEYSLAHKDAYKSLNIQADSTLLKVFVPDPSIYEPIPMPEDGDWLASHEEKGQTFIQYVRSIHNTPDTKRDTLCFMPLQFFESGVPPDIMEDLADFAGRFFGMKVKVLKPNNFSNKVANRINPNSGHQQVDAGDILEEMDKVVPANAFCVGAITLCDLYPRDDWNFVFGLASLRNRVGVYSLARHMPGFWERKEPPKSEEMDSEAKAALLKRATTLMCHETGHMFGLQHCIFYHCLMMGSNHHEESDNKPLHLCPVCLRKLHLACGFNILERFSSLMEFCASRGMAKEADWFRKRLETLK